MVAHEKGQTFSCTECDFTCANDVHFNQHKSEHAAAKRPRDQMQRAESSATKRPGNDKPNPSPPGDVEGVWKRDEAGQRQFAESLSHGWSDPVKNGKPRPTKDLLKASNAPQNSTSKRRNTATVGTGRESDLSIRERKFTAEYFASRYKPYVDKEAVKQDIENELLRLTGKVHTVSIVQLKAKRDHYASFKITCLCENPAIFDNPDLWPENVLFRKWVQSRKRS